MNPLDWLLMFSENGWWVIAGDPTMAINGFTSGKWWVRKDSPAPKELFSERDKEGVEPIGCVGGKHGFCERRWDWGICEKWTFKRVVEAWIQRFGILCSMKEPGILKGSSSEALLLFIGVMCYKWFISCRPKHNTSVDKSLLAGTGNRHANQIPYFNFEEALLMVNLASISYSKVEQLMNWSCPKCIDTKGLAVWDVMYSNWFDALGFIGFYPQTRAKVIVFRWVCFGIKSTLQHVDMNIVSWINWLHLHLLAEFLSEGQMGTISKIGWRMLGLISSKHLWTFLKPVVHWYMLGSWAYGKTVAWKITWQGRWPSSCLWLAGMDPFTLLVIPLVAQWPLCVQCTWSTLLALMKWMFIRLDPQGLGMRDLKKYFNPWWESLLITALIANWNPPVVLLCQTLYLLKDAVLNLPFTLFWYIGSNQLIFAKELCILHCGQSCVYWLHLENAFR